jgi:hypothetical protein
MKLTTAHLAEALKVSPIRHSLFPRIRTTASVGILGQLVRAKYNDLTKEVSVGQSPLNMDIHVHILNGIPASGSDGTVGWNFSPAIARSAVETYIRRLYAQANIQLGSLNVSTVPSVANLIAISHITGLEATGGGQISLEIESQRAGQTIQWSLSYPTQTRFHAAADRATDGGCD